MNGTDLVALANIILGKDIETAAADVNGDGAVSGTDLVALADLVLGKAKAPQRKAALNPLPKEIVTNKILEQQQF